MPRRKVPADKPTVDRQWFFDKMAERDMSLRSLSALMGFAHPSMLSRRFSGLLNTTSTEANDLAAHLGVPLTEVLAHLGVRAERDTRKLVPVVGLADGAGTVDAKGVSRFRKIDRPPETSDAIAAIRIEAQGHRMDGWHLYFEPSRSVAPDAVGRLAVTEDLAGVRRIGWLHRSEDRGRWAIDMLANTISASIMLRWAAPVAWIRP